MALGAGLTPSLSPGLAVVLSVIIGALGGTSFGVTNVGALVILNVLSVALTTTLIVMAQGDLNQYWERVKGANLRDARVGIGEVIFVLLGLVAWAGSFVPA